MDPRYNIANRLLRHHDAVACYRRVLGKSAVESFTPTAADCRLLQQALTHESYCGEDQKDPLWEGVALQPASYERMEFVGDTFLQWIVADYLAERFPRANEHILTKLKISIIRKEMVAEFSRAMGLPAFALLSAQSEALRTDDTLAEDIMEAWICATVKGSGGVALGTALIHALIEKCVDFKKLTHHDTNYKDCLMRWFQSKGRWTPALFRSQQLTRNGVRWFVVAITDPSDGVVGRGEGATLREGEQKAALDALGAIGAVNGGAAPTLRVAATLPAATLSHWRERALTSLSGWGSATIM
jgi:ribonuclease-3